MLTNRLHSVLPDAFAEIVVWRVPESAPPPGHPFRYLLVHALGGACVVRQGDERGNGDHRHICAHRAPTLSRYPNS